MFSIDYKRFFPFGSVRPEQDTAIKFILDAFMSQPSKKFVIAELGTGVGKSAIGITVARYINSSYFDDGIHKPGAYVLTTQKVLQEQYLRDFAPPVGNLISIKSSNNYQCEYHKDNTCGESARIVKNAPKGSPFWQKCMNDCAYKREKKKFLESTESTTNYSYFLAESMYSGKITPRDVLILDEAHNIESELSKFIEVTISERFAHDTLKLTWPETEGAKTVIKWLKEEYEPTLNLHLTKAQAMIDKLNLKDKLKEFKILATQIEMLDKHLCKVNRFLTMWNDDNWVLNVVPASGKALRKFEFKPVDVSPYSHDMLYKFGKRVLLLSATIVNRDVFCETVGINKDDAAFISIDSPFPIMNRPIYYAPVGNMGASMIDQSLPKLVEMVKLILDQHKGEKGIIHAHSYKIAKYIKANIKSRRLLIHDSFDRDEIVAKHTASQKDTVLLSPSLTEGIDLKDDLSRFQIICKVPYPYLGDKLVRKRMSKNKSWYAYQTAKSVVQSTGRSVRNETDHAVTYILDEGWSSFYDRNSELLPDSFKKALKHDT